MTSRKVKARAKRINEIRIEKRRRQNNEKFNEIYNFVKNNWNYKNLTKTTEGFIYNIEKKDFFNAIKNIED